MTLQTGDLSGARGRMGRLDGIDNLGVTVPASLLGDHPALRPDLNVVLVTAGGEEKRMPKTIRRFGQIFADEARRSVTAVAACNRAVR